MLRLHPRCLLADPDELVATFEKAGFRLSPAGRPSCTILLDIRPPLDELRAALKGKWRNHLNSAGRKGLTVRVGTEPELLDDFKPLYEQLVERKGFEDALGVGFYQPLQARLPEGEKLVVVMAYGEGRPVSGHVVSMLGDTCVSILAATDDEGLKRKASYLCQWATIVAASERGLSYYDQGGINPDANPGVYHFKAGLGGREITVPGPFDCYPPGWRRLAVQAAERAYRWWSKGRTS